MKDKDLHTPNSSKPIRNTIYPSTFLILPAITSHSLALFTMPTQAEPKYSLEFDTGEKNEEGGISL